MMIPAAARCAPNSTKLAITNLRSGGGLRRLCTGAPKDKPFNPDTPFSRKLYFGTIAAVTGFGAYLGWTIWSDFYSSGAKEASAAAVRDIPLFAGNPVVFLDVEVDKRPLGRIVIQLRKDVVPATAENFRALCTGEKGIGYRDTKVHAIIPGSYVHAGDITHGTGEGGMSIYGETFPDENFRLQHIGPGIVSMANQGNDSNNSQFLITLCKAPLYDKKFVAVGNVMSGMEVVTELAKYGNWRGHVKRDIRIARSGELQLADPQGTASHSHAEE